MIIWGTIPNYGVLQGLLQEFSGEFRARVLLVSVFEGFGDRLLCGFFGSRSHCNKGSAPNFHGSGPRGGTKVGRVSVVPYDIPRPSPKHPT